MKPLPKIPIHDPFICKIARPKSPHRNFQKHALSRRAPLTPAPTIVLVDDDLLVRDVLGRKLRASGCTVRCAANPEEALVLLNDTVPDLVITELSSGTVSGWDLLFHETMERPSLPIIVISALPAGAVYGAEQFAREFFQKPLDIDRLVEAVQRCLEQKVLVGRT